MKTIHSHTALLTTAMLTLASLMAPQVCYAADKGAQQNIDAFIVRAAKDTGWTSAEVRALLQQAELKPKVIELMDKPGESIPWYSYKERVVTEERITKGLQFMSTYQDALSRAQNQYGVPKEIITAIIGVESKYGENKGKFRVLDSLATLAFHYPRRALFFQDELYSFLALTKKSRVDPLTVSGSYAGAIGWPQFMPSSARKMAVDFDADGIIDLVNSPVDAIGSVGLYFNKNGWITGENTVTSVSEKINSNLEMAGRDGKTLFYRTLPNFIVIKRYNRSDLYALAVAELAQELHRRSSSTNAD